jgi:hypothetical protein
MDFQKLIGFATAVVHTYEVLTRFWLQAKLDSANLSSEDPGGFETFRV